MRRILGIASAVMTAVLLTACGTTTGGPGGGGAPGGDTVDETVTARTGSGAVLADQPSVSSFVLEPGEDRLYRVRTPVSDEAALFVYLNRDLPLYLYSGSGSLFATSRSSTYFAAGQGGLALAASGGGGTADALEPQVVETQTCPGSCIIADNPGSGNVFVRVHNPTSSTRSFTLWAIVTDFADENETAATRSQPVSVFGTEEGAIETIDDEDYFIVEDDGELFLDYFDNEGTGLDLVAEVIPFGSDTPIDTISAGESTIVEWSDTVIVYATNPRAAVSANSTYFLELVTD